VRTLLIPLAINAAIIASRRIGGVISLGRYRLHVLSPTDTTDSNRPRTRLDLGIIRPWIISRHWMSIRSVLGRYMVMPLRSTERSGFPRAAFRTGHRRMTITPIRTRRSIPAWIHRAYIRATLFISTRRSCERLLHSPSARKLIRRNDGSAHRCSDLRITIYATTIVSAHYSPSL
jgi:hypothetical protein